jgi:hypothetical protein
MSARAILASLVVVACGCTEDVPLTPTDLALAPPDLIVLPCKHDSDCARTPMTPRCDVTSGQCVACLPVNDNCVTGNSCRKVNNVWTCALYCLGKAECAKILGPTADCCGGFCFDLETDVLNCGACGMACPAVSNGMPGCVSGSCFICDCGGTGFSACGPRCTGCTQLGSDPTNCGGCGIVCPTAPNAGAYCVGGRCSVVCLPGYADCNGTLKDGCEILTDGDVANCGGCGKACGAPANASPACDSGKCGYRCQAGFGDCDGDPANGCETDVTASVASCGHCGNVCPVRANARAAACVASTCGSVCNLGFGDCDGSRANGCEADLGSDAVNCGQCGARCALGQSCVAGKCS